MGEYRKKKKRQLARFSLPKCWGVFATGMAIIVWCHSAIGEFKVERGCNKLKPPMDFEVGYTSFRCSFECNAPETRNFHDESQNSVRRRTNLSSQNQAIRGFGVKSSSSSLYPYLECSSKPGTETRGSQVELNLHLISTWKYKGILFKNFAACKLVASPFRTNPVIEVLQFENVGRLDLSSLDLVAPNLSLEIRHSSVVFSQYTWSVRIRSLTMFNVSAHVLPLTMAGFVEKVSIAEGTFNSTSCPDEDEMIIRQQSNGGIQGTSVISIMDSYIHTMFECKSYTRISIDELQMTRVEIAQIQRYSLRNVKANNVIFNTCTIDHLQYAAFHGLQVKAMFRLEEITVGQVDSYVLWGISTPYQNSATIEVLRSTFRNVSGSSSFSVSGYEKLLSEQNKAHLANCSCAVLQGWMKLETDGVLPLEQVVCDPRTENEPLTSAEELLCHNVECFPRPSKKYCSIHGLNGSADNSTQLHCIANHEESPYLPTTWFSQVLKHAADCKRIKEVKIEKIGTLALNFTWPLNAGQQRADNFPLNELTSPQLDLLEIRGITKVIFSTASSEFVQCCKRITINDMSRISFDEYSTNWQETTSINYLEIASLVEIVGGTEANKPYVRLEFLNTNRNDTGLKMKISCCQNFSIERDFELTRASISNLVRDCLRNCKSKDVACVEQQVTSDPQKGSHDNHGRHDSKQLRWKCNLLQSKVQEPAIMSNNTLFGPDHSLRGIVIQARGTLILRAGAISNLNVSSRITLQNIPDLQLIGDDALQTSPAIPELIIHIQNCTVTKFQEVFEMKGAADQGTLDQQARVKRSLFLTNVDVKAPLPALHLWRAFKNVIVNFTSIASLVAGTHSADLRTNRLGDKYPPSNGTFGRLRILNSDVKVIETNAVHLDHVEVLSIANSTIGLMTNNAIRIGDLQTLRLQNILFSEVESTALRVNVSGDVVFSNNNILHLRGMKPFEIMSGKKPNLETVDKVELGNGSCSCASMIPDPEGSSVEPEDKNLTFTHGFLQIEFECRSTHGTMIPASEYQSTTCAGGWQNLYIIITWSLLILVPIIMAIAGVKWVHHKRRTDRRSSGDHVEILKIHAGNSSAVSTVAGPALLPDPSGTGIDSVSASVSNPSKCVAIHPIFEYAVDDGEYIGLPPPIGWSEPSQGPIPILEIDHMQQVCGGRSEPIFAEIPCRLGSDLDDRPYAEIVENVYSEPFEGVDGASVSGQEGGLQQSPTDHRTDRSLFLERDHEEGTANHNIPNAAIRYHNLKEVTDNAQ